MALIVKLNCFKYLEGKEERIAKLTFRGRTFTTSTLPSLEPNIYFGESFRWLLAAPLHNDETLQVKLYSHKKYLSNKLVGTFTMVLQELVSDKELQLSEPLIDHNNKVMKSIVEMNVRYVDPTRQDYDEVDGDDYAAPLRQELSQSTLSKHGSVFNSTANEDDLETQTAMESKIMAMRARNDIMDKVMQRPKDFQVCVKIIEAQQLHGINVDAVVRVDVGGAVKYTSIKQSTNCPFFNEYFVFDCYEAPSLFFDKIITITAYNAARIPGRSVLKAGNMLAGKAIGSFKCDIGTVYAAQDHQFFHKWAVLLDTEVVNEGPRGYVKCDLSVSGPGDIIKVPRLDIDEDDIEGNLLLPAGIQVDRQQATYHITIYNGKDLPCMDTGVIASMKKAFSMKNTAFIDAYVRISFIGLVGKTSVVKSYNPQWNEKLSFPDMFPPFCYRIKLQLMDQDALKDDVLATHFIELSQIMDPGGDTKGIPPTFGPAWINFYGSPRFYKMVENTGELNQGLVEGVAYKGRVYISVQTELADNDSAGKPSVKKGSPSSEPKKHGAEEEFLLFGTLYDASMINGQYARQQVYFELSCGLAGNKLDASPEKSGSGNNTNSENETAPLVDDKTCSNTPPLEPCTEDGKCYYLDIGNTKPCLYVPVKDEDHCFRLCRQNIVCDIVEALDAGLEEAMEDRNKAQQKLINVLEKLNKGIEKYFRFFNKETNKKIWTDLDKHRHMACSTTMDKIGKSAKIIAEEMRKSTENNMDDVTDDSVKDRLKKVQRRAKEWLTGLRPFSKEPQNSIPDTFVWMIVNKKRVAYVRIPTRDILDYSGSRGKECGKMQTLFLKTPGKNSISQSSQMQAKLTMYLWFGLSDSNHNYMKNLPLGFKDPPELPPTQLEYTDVKKFHLRVYLYQAKNLIGSDNTGLSDPFARVIVDNQCQETDVKKQTLSPRWKRIMTFKNVITYGASQPLCLVEIFDYDLVGSPEYLGYVMVRPSTKPQQLKLQWWPVYRGIHKAGHILASFEMLKVDVDIPPVIKPVKCRYRIEVMFWGMRNLKRVHLMTVDRPQVDVECAGYGTTSSIIKDVKKNSNFEKPISYIDLELPEEKYYWPALTVRCVDCRSFGRDVLVGTHTVANMLIYEEEKLKQKQSKAVTESQNADTEMMITHKEACQVGLHAEVNDTGEADPDFVTTPLLRADHAASYTTSDTILHIPNTTPLLQDGGDQQLGDIKLEDQPHKLKDQTCIAQQEHTLLSESDEVERRKERRKQHENSKDFDWWSKYYSSQNSKQNLDKEENELTDSDNDSLSTDMVPVINQIVFKDMDAKLEKLKEQHAQERLLKTTPEKKQSFWKYSKKAFKLKKRDEEKFAKSVYTEEVTIALEEEDTQKQKDKNNHGAQTLKIYEGELEKVREFGGFKEWVNTYDLYRGKQLEDQSKAARVTASFKGNFCIYKLEEGTQTVKFKLLEGIPPSKPHDVFIRVYIIKAIDLHPADLNGKADPYVVIECGKVRINDKENRKYNQLNPVFGKCYELDTVFPMDSMMRIQIMDYDAFTADDLIGETVIDLENRFYSKHHASCGISNSYEICGYNTWRDPSKPSQILAHLCKSIKVAPPDYTGPGEVRVLGHTFYADDIIFNNQGDELPSVEPAALEALKNWHTLPGGWPLVPEHIETRNLYSPEKPGLPQGKLEMWIDMFPKSQTGSLLPVNIKPREPCGFELRVIIWNTANVRLDDTNVLTGEASSDIFVKGCLYGMGLDDQCTDVHYRSLDGEGNFNWRFVFPFEYSKSDEKIVRHVESGVLSLNGGEEMLPAKLQLQVWDADLVSADDYLGCVVLNLHRIPKPAKTADSCSLDIMKPASKSLNLFKHKRCKGWWPFEAKDEQTGQVTLVGKVEAEIQLVSSYEAEKVPVGLGREKPQPLSEPKRPDSSFLWFMNPLKTLKFVIWKKYKWWLVRILVFVLLVLFIVLFFYNFPGNMARKVFHI